jgi:hypothetical protein
MDPDRYLLNELDNELIFRERIVPDIFKEAVTVTNPRLITIGGQPGAGKSRFLKFAAKLFEKSDRIVEISRDKLRNYHPLYNELLVQDEKTAFFYTGLDAYKWLEKSLTLATDLRINLLVEGTMKSPFVVEKILNLFCDANYKINVCFLAVNKLISLAGIFHRYEQEKFQNGYARFGIAAHQPGYDGIVKSLELIEEKKLVDNIVLYRRDGQMIFHNQRVNGEWINPPQGVYKLIKERERQLTIEELQEQVEYCAETLRLVLRKERNATAEHIVDVKALFKKFLTLLSEARKTKYWLPQENQSISTTLLQ